MQSLTRQQRLALIAVAGLLLTGWSVKAWRVSHPRTVQAGEKAPADR